jgi:hypothetical protein
MRMFGRLLDKPYRVAVKYRCASIVVGAAALACSSLGVSEPAVAQTCAPVANGGSFSAGSATTVCTGTFNSNINFGGPPSPPPSVSTLRLAPSATSVISPGGNAVNIQNAFNATDGSGAEATINANDATITNINNPGGTSQSALRIVASGNATITASGPINISGGQSTNAIFSTVLTTVDGTQASVIYNGAGRPERTRHKRYWRAEFHCHPSVRQRWM